MKKQSFVRTMIPLLSLVLSLSLMACGGAGSLGSETAFSEGRLPNSTLGDAATEKAGTLEKPTTEVLNQLNQAFYCALGENGYNLYFHKGGRLEVVSSQQGEGSAEGNWKANGEKLLLSVPSVGFSEASTSVETRFGLLVTFATASLSCHTWKHGLDENVSGYFKCPSIKYIPTVSYEDNTFEFKPGGHVIQKRFKELLGTDTLVRTSHGVYRLVGNQLYMAFGDRTEERYFTGQFQSNAAFIVEQLEPEKGPCRAN